MELPLLIRAQENDEQFLLSTADNSAAEVSGDWLIPNRLPALGEQYRFHFDMTQCIGCKCCVVACNEQNGNPADVQWRRVGEIEGGSYPDTIRLYLSMGCNHCLDPTCMTGCPVNAYIKDPLTGIVLHSAERCIGCQYCTWNCSYGVPQYNPERGVVGKCDMCYGRLSEAREPACVAACPQQAIRIEIIPVDAWRENYVSQANAPGLPSADDSISTTRITLRDRLPADIGRVDVARVDPQRPQWSLIFMTVFTQLAVGAIAIVALLRMGAHLPTPRPLVTGIVLVALLALASSVLHLGRPLYAFRALMGWRRSWLSREVLFFSLFSAGAVLYALLLWTTSRSSNAIGIGTSCLGIGGVYASARLYMVRARPAWNSVHTILEFGLSGVLTGSLAAALFLPAARPVVALAGVCSAMALAIQQLAKVILLRISPEFERRAAADLLLHRFRWGLFARHGGLWALALTLSAQPLSLPILTICLVGAIGLELLSRWLFFVSVVPKSIAASWLGQRPAA